MTSTNYPILEGSDPLVDGAPIGQHNRGDIVRVVAQGGVVTSR